MASIREINGKLFWDFRFRNQRCREYTLLDDTPDNRRKMAKVLKKIEDEMATGTFEYRRHFPSSKHAAKFDEGKEIAAQSSPAVLHASVGPVPTVPTPLLKEFAETWFSEFSVAWRRTYLNTVRSILDQHLLPAFGERAVSSIRREDILRFRSDLAKVRGRKQGSMLSPRRINAITLVLRQILNEAADRFDFSTPALRIKPLKVKKTDIQPFTLEEVKLIVESVRTDFRSYYAVRFFTGMRTGEIDSLKWQYVDFDKRLITIRETLVHGQVEADTKTISSQRDIQMSQIVFDALKAQEKATRHLSEFVFCNRDGQPLDVNNVTKRVWYPLLRHLGLALRNPYQTRHTAATLWLASGENPEWIARQLGHANTQMLFTVYSRFVPNLTRKDGSAFERLLTSAMGNGERQIAPAANDPAPPATATSAAVTPDTQVQQGDRHG